MYFDVIVIDCIVRKGSIVVLFNMIVFELKWEVMVDKLWEDVKEGLKFEFNGEMLIILLIMKVDGEIKKVEFVLEDEDCMFVYIIVVVCVGVFVVILIFVIVLYCVCWKNREVKIVLILLEILDLYSDNEKGKEFLSVDVKYVIISKSEVWFV